MEGGKKLLLVIVCLAVIAGGIVLTVRRTRAGKQPPKELGERMVEMIDSESLDVISRSWKEWRDDGREGGMFMNPNTKKHTMVTPLECPFCGAKTPSIAPPEMSPEMEPEQETKLRLAYDNAYMNQKCIKCGKRLMDAPAESARGRGR